MKDADCYGDKFSNERVTVLLATNANGTEKLKPYVIGNLTEPRCLTGVNNLPVNYGCNQKARMSSHLFSAWILALNEKMQRQNRHLILFIGNSVAHSFLPTLSNIKVHLLPTSPFDLGIISSFKLNYRGEIVKKIIHDFETNEKPSVNLLHAMRMVDKSWRNVSQNTIINCFKQAGIKVQNLTKNWNEKTEFTFVEVGVRQPQIEISYSVTQQQWLNVNVFLNVSEPITFEEYVNVDENLIVTGLLSNGGDSELYEEDDCVCERVNVNEARTALNKLKTFFEKSDISDKNLNDAFSSIYQIDNLLDQQVLSYVKQKKITDYFSKI